MPDPSLHFDSAPTGTVTERLPFDILIDIIESLPKKDQFSLCYVSQGWSEVCLFVINRVVLLRSVREAKAFLLGVQTKPGRAVAIRSFAIAEYLYPRIESIKILLEDVIKLMIPHLQHLSVPSDLLGAFTLHHGTFPNLISYNCNPYTYSEPHPDVTFIGFLKRHPDLTNLCVRALGNASTSPTLLRVHLPNLQWFDGDAKFLPALTTQQLREARLTWSWGDDFEQPIVALRSMASPGMPFASINNGINYERERRYLVEALATHLPNLKTLHMRAAINVGWLEEDTLEYFTTQLPRFKRLRYFAIEDMLSYRSAFRSEHQIMHPVVVNWARVCPTLEACCIHQFCFKKNGGEWVFCTRKEFHDLTGGALWNKFK
ncbi:hypothetical protein MSAN_01067600 [Mycena sanguinolenta]|uniref:F-box domain-containing protein n=1 Tax=Mycena sanguinolenta TaxID=230812 RepID=A0A8H6YSJ3_9AGAR|nr:hypothetical protein MSAN_01067600 [Mycena sanguinolenta]